MKRSIKKLNGKMMMNREMNTEIIADRIKYIFLQMEDAVCITGMNGELFFTNASAEKLFGIQHGDRRKIWDAIPYVKENDDLIQLFIDAVMEKQKTMRSLVDYVNNSGDLFHLHVSLTCEEEDNGVILIVISDLTALTKVRSAFTRYTSPDIADYVLSTPEGGKAGGEAREVSILMSDLRGFTALSARMPSEDLVTMLNHYFGIMEVVIERNRGTVIEFLGDGLFIVFGAPKKLSDHAEAAVRCAIEMENAMEEVNQWNQDHGYPELEMGIAINSGSVTVGNIGSEKKMKYGCIGEAVNLAGRIESFCIGGQIYLSENTRGLIHSPLSFAGTKSFLPKGSPEEMTIYDVTGIGETLLRREAGAVEWVPLPGVQEIPFFVLSGKAVTKEQHTGRINRISTDEKYGMLSSDISLESMENLMFMVGDSQVYAKVISREETEYKLCFTSKPGKLADLFRISGTEG